MAHNLQHHVILDFDTSTLTCRECKTTAPVSMTTVQVDGEACPIPNVLLAHSDIAIRAKKQREE